MKKNIILAVAALGLASSAFAFQTAEDHAPVAAQTGAPVSTAQVQADLQQYLHQVASAPARAESTSPVTVQTGAPVSRSQVQAELQRYEQQVASRPARAEDGAPLL